MANEDQIVTSENERSITNRSFFFFSGYYNHGIEDYTNKLLDFHLSLMTILIETFFFIFVCFMYILSLYFVPYGHHFLYFHKLNFLDVHRYSHLNALYGLILILSPKMQILVPTKKITNHWNYFIKKHLKISNGRLCEPDSGADVLLCCRSDQSSNPLTCFDPNAVPPGKQRGVNCEKHHHLFSL